MHEAVKVVVVTIFDRVACHMHKGLVDQRENYILAPEIAWGIYYHKGPYRSIE